MFFLLASGSALGAFVAWVGNSSPESESDIKLRLQNTTDKAEIVTLLRMLVEAQLPSYKSVIAIAYNRLAQSCLLAGEYPEAAALFRRMRDYDPSGTSLVRSLLGEARALRNQGKHPDTVPMLQKAIVEAEQLGFDHRTMKAHCLRELGLHYFERGQHREAARLFAEAVGTYRNDHEQQYWLECNYYLWDCLQSTKESRTLARSLESYHIYTAGHRVDRFFASSWFPKCELRWLDHLKESGSVDRALQRVRELLSPCLTRLRNYPGNNPQEDALAQQGLAALIGKYIELSEGYWGNKPDSDNTLQLFIDACIYREALGMPCTELQDTLAAALTLLGKPGSPE